MYREFRDSVEGFDAAEYEYYMNDRYGDEEEYDDDYDDYEDDGQPSEYTEWQDYMGGDDWDHGQYDCEY
jgi:hypothetical protein